MTIRPHSRRASTRPVPAGADCKPCEVDRPCAYGFRRAGGKRTVAVLVGNLIGIAVLVMFSGAAGRVWANDAAELERTRDGARSGEYERENEDAFEHWLATIDDDRDRVRRAAQQRILDIVDSGDLTFQRRCLQRLLRESLTPELQSQVMLSELVAEVQQRIHRGELDRVVLSGEPTPTRHPEIDSDLVERWQRFSARAGDDGDAKNVFTSIAERAGPRGHWPCLSTRPNHHERVINSALRMSLVSHLGCGPTDGPLFYTPQSATLLRTIETVASHESGLEWASAQHRVIRRLVDHALIENPHRWSMRDRLSLALIARRESVVENLCGRVFASDNASANDLAHALLAAHRIGMPTDDHGCDDSRMLLIPAADQVSHRVRFRTSSVAENQKMHRSSKKTDRSDLGPGERFAFDRITVHPRVRDVADYVVMAADGIDPRSRGMLLIQADPVWGVKVASIGMPE